MEGNGGEGKPRQKEGDRLQRGKVVAWSPTASRVLSPFIGRSPPRLGEGVPATRRPREMRNGARRRAGRKESGGRPERAGRRTRDRDESRTYAHTLPRARAHSCLRRLPRRFRQHVSPTLQAPLGCTTSAFGMCPAQGLGDRVAICGPGRLPLPGPNPPPMSPERGQCEPERGGAGRGSQEPLR